MNNAICSNKDAIRGYHAKGNESERERQLPYDITYTWNLKYRTNEPISKKETDSQTWRTDQTCGCQGGGRGMEWEVLRLADVSYHIVNR